MNAIISRNQLWQNAYNHITGGKSKRVAPDILTCRVWIEVMQERDRWIWTQAARIFAIHGIESLVILADCAIELLLEVDESYATSLLTSDMFSNDEDVATATAHGYAVLMWYKLKNSGQTTHMEDFTVDEAKEWLSQYSAPVQFDLFAMEAV